MLVPPKQAWLVSLGESILVLKDDNEIHINSPVSSFSGALQVILNDPQGIYTHTDTHTYVCTHTYIIHKDIYIYIDKYIYIDTCIYI